MNIFRNERQGVDASSLLQKAQLSQAGRATLHVVENLAVTRVHLKLHR